MTTFLDDELFNTVASVLKIIETGMDISSARDKYIQKYIDLEVLTLENTDLVCFFCSMNGLVLNTSTSINSDKYLVIKARTLCYGLDMGELLKSLSTLVKPGSRDDSAYNRIAVELLALFKENRKAKNILIYNKFLFHPKSHCLTLAFHSGRIVIEHIKETEDKIFNQEGTTVVMIQKKEGDTIDYSTLRIWLKIRSIFKTEACLTSIFLTEDFLKDLCTKNAKLLEYIVKSTSFINALSLEDPEDQELLFSLDQSGFNLERDFCTNKILTMSFPNLEESALALLKEFLLEEKMCAYEGIGTLEGINIDLIVCALPKMTNDSHLEFVLLENREIQMSENSNYLKCMKEILKNVFNKQIFGTDDFELSFTAANSFLHRVSLDCKGRSSSFNLLMLMNVTNASPIANSYFSTLLKPRNRFIEVVSLSLSRILCKLKDQLLVSLFRSRREEELSLIENVSIPSIAESLTNIAETLELFPDFDAQEFSLLIGRKLQRILIFGSDV